MEDILVPIGVVGMLFIGLPWLIFHYVTQWKKNSALPIEDEKLLDELHDLARRLDDRLRTIERIVAVDDPAFASRLRLTEERSDDDITADRIQDRLRAR